MWKSPSPYSIETIQGTLELSKGAYLTMIKRKSSTLKTLTKSKKISRCDKPTLKKSIKMHASYHNEGKVFGQSTYTQNMVKSMKTHCVRNQIELWDQNNHNMVGFKVWNDCDLFDVKGIPHIEMDGDNDEESNWQQVDEHKKGMTMALSVATYDRMYN